MAGNNEVGRIYIRVIPKFDGFRERVKAEAEKAAKEASGREIKFEAKVDAKAASKKAAKEASGEDVDFDAKLDEKQLKRKAATAAQLASGEKVNFGIDFDRAGLRGLRNALSRGFNTVNLDNRFDAIGKAKVATDILYRGLVRVNRVGFRAIQNLNKGFKGFGRTAKTATRPILAVGRGLSSVVKQSAGWGWDHIRRDFTDIGREIRIITRDTRIWAGQNKRLASANKAIRNELGLIKKDWLEVGRLTGKAFSPLTRATQPLQSGMRQIKQQMRDIRDEWAWFGDGVRKLGGNATSPLQAGLNRIKQDVRDIRQEWGMIGDISRKVGISIGNSNSWARITKQAERAARAVRNIGTSGSRIPRARGAWIPQMAADAKKADTGFRGLFSSIRKVGKSLRGASNDSQGFFKNFRQKYFQPDSTIGFVVAAVVAAIAPLAGIIGSLLAGLPTLLAGVGAAAAVVALGFEGIKDAAQPLVAALNPLKSSLASVFRQELTPQFEKLAAIIPALTPGMEGLARGISSFTGAFVDAVSAPETVEKLNTLLEHTSGLFTDMGPGIASFTDGFTTMFEGASRGFPAMAAVFNDFADLFSRDMTMLVDTGQMQAAMESLATVTGSLFEGLHNIFVAGIQQMPKMTEGFVAMFDGISEGLVKAMPALATFSNAVGIGIGALATHIGTVFEAIGPGLERTFSSIGTMFSTFMESMGPVLVDVAGRLSNSLASVFETLEPVITRLSPKIAEIVDRLGNGFADVIDNLVASGTLDSLATSLTDLASAGGAMFLSFLEAIIPLLPQIVENLTSFADTLAGGLAEDLTRLAVDGIPQFVDGLEAVVKVLDKVIAVMDGLAKVPLLKSGIGGMLGGLMKGQGLSGAVGGLIDGIMNAGSNAEEATPKVETFSTTMDTLNTRMSQPLPPPNWAEGLTVAGEQAQIPLLNFGNSISGTVGSGVASASADLMSLGPTATAAAASATAGIQIGMGSLGSTMSLVATAAVNDVSTGLAPLPGIASAAGTDAVTSASTALAPLPGIVQGAADDMTTAADTGMAGMNTAFQTGVDTSGQIASTLIPTVQGAIGNTNALFPSGLALGNSFAAGIRASIPAAAAAAAELAGAVKANMPNSPAKEGPLSGNGYTDVSGMALAKDFAGGILANRHYAQDAAATIADDVKQGLESYQKSLNRMHDVKLTQPIMESNAKKIADFRKREREAHEKGNADLEKIAEDRQKMLDSLEHPDLRDINASFRSYYIDGTKEMMQKGLLQQARDVGFTNQIRRTALQAVGAVRDEIGDHPILAGVEANVNADHFAWAVEQAIDESGIGYLPIELGIANLEQFKSDLGFGDGVISRAMTAALDFDPNNSDAHRYDDRPNEEIHYHVSDMEEAIRLENERRSRQSLRFY